jgi:hypothetical protein
MEVTRQRWLQPKTPIGSGIPPTTRESTSGGGRTFQGSGFLLSEAAIKHLARIAISHNQVTE